MFPCEAAGWCSGLAVARCPQKMTTTDGEVSSVVTPPGKVSQSKLHWKAEYKSYISRDGSTLGPLRVRDLTRQNHGHSSILVASPRKQSVISLTHLLSPLRKKLFQGSLCLELLVFFDESYFSLKCWSQGTKNKCQNCTCSSNKKGGNQLLVLYLVSCGTELWNSSHFQKACLVWKTTISEYTQSTHDDIAFYTRAPC